MSLLKKIGLGTLFVASMYSGYKAVECHKKIEDNYSQLQKLSESKRLENIVNLHSNIVLLDSDIRDSTRGKAGYSMRCDDLGEQVALFKKESENANQKYVDEKFGKYTSLIKQYLGRSQEEKELENELYNSNKKLFGYSLFGVIGIGIIGCYFQNRYSDKRLEKRGSNGIKKRKDIIN